ncbi:hypothetical protein HP567_015855 [Brevibacillus sp. M2.1A]|uniref:hypothetical protein n=1 Tax=Brevibacillus TaxID=55080 RepID=UPI00156AEEB6|nr:MULTISPECIES: hypothetical protein [Brevibacillus]MBY0084436.1 hypothetical protein [Brevibacillus brevis]MCC8436019.1 hypothetical protein [Brevibacillus sp. M2.1A]MCM3142406.1 hypothetical protein [Brevibacillus sp. MER 51]
MLKTDRAKVTIQCNVCGEKFTLRGQREPGGQIETGFKQCLCDNDKHFRIDES